MLNSQYMKNSQFMNSVITYVAEHGLFTIDLIGFIGPLLLMCITFIHLWTFYRYLIVYVVFFVVNIMINKWLKLWIRQPRPSGGKSILGEVYTGEHEYGMPSAHAQTAMYSIVYLYSVSQHSLWLVIGLWIASLTIYQRWSYNRHTIAQLFVGVLVGGVMAYIAKWAADYWITERHFW